MIEGEGPRICNLVPGENTGPLRSTPEGGITVLKFDVVSDTSRRPMRTDRKGRLRVPITRDELNRMPMICNVPEEKMAGAVLKALGEVRSRGGGQ